MNKALVRHDLDLRNLPPLTQEQKVQLAVLESQTDSETDHSDIASLTEDFWKSAELRRF
jgi:hypothetical protein